jgi:hypothetical protein
VNEIRSNQESQSKITKEELTKQFIVMIEEGKKQHHEAIKNERKEFLASIKQLESKINTLKITTEASDMKSQQRSIEKRLDIQEQQTDTLKALTLKIGIPTIPIYISVQHFLKHIFYFKCINSSSIMSRIR